MLLDRLLRLLLRQKTARGSRSYFLIYKAHPLNNFLYKTTDYYAPEHERGVAWNDPAIGVDWPLAAHGIAEPLLSEKDRAAPALAQAETFA